MTPEQQRVLDTIAFRLAVRLGIDRAEARVAVEEAAGGRGPHLAEVQAEFRAMAAELEAAGQPAVRFAAALHRAARRSVRIAVHERERGRRFVARHPDLVALDRRLNRLYERPTG
ncbi:hypothetical protein QMK19_04060 [Streptomyces sp. H10-C2]|uniref:hypothetical protein n=1 Tax=unclassified Streptomyces TaxID=2593676 RepID=UPI0024BA8C2A|nr:MULTISPECIES: hypothetical protein [unclassified Streptomyces]MDJ0343547.1 hypothetical protein [Streptomyces sp. PH10-H1]MDJ0368877.1 hypothetical protein [Streptomyces sp. H10-C2]